MTKGDRIVEGGSDRLQHLAEKASAHGGGGSTNPIAVIGAAGAAGLFLAKLLDWRGHAHPRD